MTVSPTPNSAANIFAGVANVLGSIDWKVIAADIQGGMPTVDAVLSAVSVAVPPVSGAKIAADIAAGAILNAIKAAETAGIVK